MPKIASPYLRVGLVWLAMIVIWLLLPILRNQFWGTPLGDYSLGGHVMSALLATALAVPVVVTARLVIDRRSIESLGFDMSPNAIRFFAMGALAFLLPAALGFALVLGLGWAELVPLAPISEIALFVPLLIVLVFLFEALPEELAFRGYIQGNLVPPLGYWGAIFAQAALFALWGAALWTITTGALALDRLVMFFFVALVLGIVRGVTGSVWTSIGLHVAFQTLAQLVLSSERGHFAARGIEMLQLIALGVVPFSLAALLTELMKGRTKGSAVDVR